MCGGHLEFQNDSLHLTSHCAQGYGLAGYALNLGGYRFNHWNNHLRDSDDMIHNIAAMFFKLAAILPKFDPVSQPTAGIKL